MGKIICVHVISVVSLYFIPKIFIVVKLKIILYFAINTAYSWAKYNTKPNIINKQ